MAEYVTRAQEFATPADALAHYGVKGMKWGVTKIDPGKAPSKSDIQDARLRVAGRNVKYHQKRTDIKRSDKSRAEKKVLLKDLTTKTLSDPDRMTAMRMTKGEKIAIGLLSVPAPLAGLGVATSRAAVGRQLNKAQAEQRARSRQAS